MRYQQLQKLDKYGPMECRMLSPAPLSPRCNPVLRSLYLQWMPRPLRLH